jgi:hypothetical protein
MASGGAFGSILYDVSLHTFAAEFLSALTRFAMMPEDFDVDAAEIINPAREPPLEDVVTE